MSPGHQNGAMGSQNGTLGYPNGAKMEPWGTQMEPKWCPKVPKYGVLDSAGDHILEHFIPQSITPQSPSNLESPSTPAVLPVLRIAKGAGGRGEALRSAAARSLPSCLRRRVGYPGQGLLQSYLSKLPKGTFKVTISHFSDLLKLGYPPPLCSDVRFP